MRIIYNLIKLLVRLIFSNHFQIVFFIGFLHVSLVLIRYKGIYIGFFNGFSVQIRLSLVVKRGLVPLIIFQVILVILVVLIVRNMVVAIIIFTIFIIIVEFIIRLIKLFKVSEYFFILVLNSFIRFLLALLQYILSYFLLKLLRGLRHLIVVILVKRLLFRPILVIAFIRSILPIINIIRIVQNLILLQKVIVFRRLFG